MSFKKMLSRHSTTYKKIKYKALNNQIDGFNNRVKSLKKP